VTCKKKLPHNTRHLKKESSRKTQMMFNTGVCDETAMWYCMMVVATETVPIPRPTVEEKEN
jgi:hypothetical protein